jgi:hypothetical protein
MYDQIMYELKTYKDEMQDIYAKNIKYDTEVAKKIDNYASGSYSSNRRYSSGSSAQSY